MLGEGPLEGILDKPVAAFSTVTMSPLLTWRMYISTGEVWTELARVEARDVRGWASLGLVLADSVVFVPFVPFVRGGCCGTLRSAIVVERVLPLGTGLREMSDLVGEAEGEPDDAPSF